MHRVLLILVVGFFSGCAPIPGGYVSLTPHTSTRLLPFGGTVIDERTRAPIAGATVSLTEHPNVARKTDASGHFEFKEISSPSVRARATKLHFTNRARSAA